MDTRPQDRPLLDAFLWLLVVVMAALVAYTSLKAPGDGSLPGSDKLLHFLAYTGLTLSTLLAGVWAPVRGLGRLPKSALPLTVASFLFGVVIEVVQGPMPGRDAELLDAFANAGGAMTAFVIWALWRIGATSPRGSFGA